MHHIKEKWKTYNIFFNLFFLNEVIGLKMADEECSETEYSLHRWACVVLEITALMSLT